MRRSLFVGLVLIMTSCLVGPASPAMAVAVPEARTPQVRPALPLEVQIWHLRFGPKHLHVTKGTTVTWRSYSLGTHSSKSYAGLWNSGPIRPGGSFTYTFRKVGIWEYRCTYHEGMRGRVVVSPP